MKYDCYHLFYWEVEWDEKGNFIDKHGIGEYFDTFEELSSRRSEVEKQYPKLEYEYCARLISESEFEI